MSTRNKLWLAVGLALVLSVVLRYIVGGAFEVGSPVVSVKAEPVFSINGSGFHFGPAMFETESHQPEGFVITNSMLMAALTTIVLTVLSLLATRNMQVVPRGFQNFTELVVDGMYNTFGSVDRKYIARFWPLVGGIFFYVLFSNWLALLPGVLSFGYRIDEATLHGGEEHAQVIPATNALAFAGESDQLKPNEMVVPQEPVQQEGTTEGEHAAEGAAEEGEHSVIVPFFRSPSADLNNTLMLGLIAFLFIEFWGFKELGLGYLSKFFPWRDGPIGIFAGVLEFISEFVRIISFAFRLFGNVFAGEVIILVMLFLFPLLPLPFLGLETFVGFIQAFVFAILVMAFASLATQAHGDHGGHGPAHDDEPHHAELGGTTRQNPVH
ncbi:MAG TPA: FoF1 ATP synthase subunit a [Herpetosiphonaceae bacterium]